MSFLITERRLFLPVAALVALITLNGCIFDTGSTTSFAEADVSSSAEPQQSARANVGWQLIWQDEFDSASLDQSKWHAVVDCWGGGNDELQCYTDRPDNGFIEDGMLHMVAKEEEHSGPKFSEIHPEYDRNDKSKTSPFTSIKLQTKNKLSIRYGRVDIRAKVAPGQGLWSALWMLPSDNVYGKWPASGEIDIMEALNPGIAANEVHGTLHYGLPWPQWENKVQEFHMDASPSDNFHVYSIEWEADEIRWYVDSKHYQTQSSAGWYNYIWQGQEQGLQVANANAPFDQEFYLIMNVAVGGNWPGDPDRDWPADRKMLVDYVRVYQCQNDLQGSPQLDGKGCATIDQTVALNTDLGKPASQQYQLYADGVETLNFTVPGGKVTNTLDATQVALADNKVVQQDVNLSDGHGKVWDVQLNGSSSVSLVSNASSTIPGYEKGLRFEGGTSWSHNGEIEFDLLVKNASADSQLLVSMATDNARKGSTAIEIPAPGKWQHVVLKVEDILLSRAEGQRLELSNVVSPFILEYQGTNAHIQIDNITLECAYNSEPEVWQLDQSCGISPRKTPAKLIFEKINEQDWTVWDCCAGAEFRQINDPQVTRPVVEFKFANAPTAPGFIAPGPINMSDYAGGTLEFDFKQITAPPPGSSWFLKLEADITAAQVALTDGGPTPNNNWQHYTFSLASQMTNADLSNIKRILVFPDWGKAEGAVMRIDNVKFVPPRK